MAATYEIVTVNRAGREHRRQYTAESELAPGSVIRLDGRDWLVEVFEDSRAIAKPARYRLTLRYPDGHEEVGAMRRYRPDAPRVGHMFTTGQISWQVVGEQLAHGDGGPYLELLAERDFGEIEDLPNHELEHVEARREELPDAAQATFERAEAAGLEVELVALEPGEAPDWAEADAYIDALILDEIEDDLLEQCGVNPDHDPRESWLETVKARLREDLRRFREDIEGDHDEIEEWDFRDGRIFASVGSFEDESDPDSGHGWLCRLTDVSAVRAAGFQRVRKAQLLP
ncbi:MAG TPA: hypothetical protein VHQ98_03110 [Gaiellaceae bacterium]|nr:hypothetical protein [Gaiellaceae bacterium]